MQLADVQGDSGLKRSILKTRVFQFAAMRGWNLAQLAREMDLDLSYVYRVKMGERRVGASFIDGARRAFPEMDVNTLFYVSDDPDKKAVGIA